MFSLRSNSVLASARTVTDEESRPAESKGSGVILIVRENARVPSRELSNASTSPYGSSHCRTVMGATVVVHVRVSLRTPLMGRRPSRLFYCSGVIAETPG